MFSLFCCNDFDKHLVHEYLCKVDREQEVKHIETSAIGRIHVR